MRGAFGGIGVVVFGLALAQGCGSGTGGPPEQMSQFSGDLVAATCRRILACCSSAEIAAVDSTIVDQASCEAGLAPTAYSELGRSPGLVDAGVVDYNGNAARACLDAIAALPCGMWGGPLNPPAVPQCDGVFVGTLAAGSACGISVECASNFCTNASSGAGNACAAPVGLGQSCEFAPCTSGLACVSSSSGGPRTCGQAAFPAGSSCSDNNDCKSGLCMADATGTGSTCVAASCNGP